MRINDNQIIPTRTIEAAFFTMSHPQTKRGRPTGSGIDDSATLKAIALAIAANSELKPTTAIRSHGITDPSTIRRLRDKFNQHREALLAEIEKKQIDKSFSRQKKDSRFSRPKQPSPHSHLLNQSVRQKTDIPCPMTNDIIKPPTPHDQPCATRMLEPRLSLGASAMATTARGNLYALSHPNMFSSLPAILARQADLSTWVLAVNFASTYRYPKALRDRQKHYI